MKYMIAAIGLLTVILNIHMCAIETETVYLFASEDTKNYDDCSRQVGITKPVLYHLLLHALESEKNDTKHELLKKIVSDPKDSTEAMNPQYNPSYFIRMTNKDAYHRLLRYIPVRGAMQQDTDGNKMYPVLVNGVASTLIIKKVERSSQADGDDGMYTTISSQELDYDMPIITKFFEIVEKYQAAVKYDDNK